MVPPSLRFLFVVHFVADIVFAIPLFFFPVRFLTALGWTAVDPVASRIVAAALFGIGIQSLLSRNAGAAAFRELLGLKVIWSSTAAIGIALSALQGGPPMAWAFAAVFAAFCGVWTTFRVKLGAATRDGAAA